MQLTFNSQSQRKGTMSFGDSQIFWPDLLRVVATEWDRCDKGSPKAKILSYEQINFPNYFAVSKEIV